MHTWSALLLSFLLASVSLTVQAAPMFPSNLENSVSTSVVPIVPVVVFGPDRRQTVEDFSKTHHLEFADVQRAQSASGLIQCGDAHGAGQLTLSADVVTTAAHVFYDEDGHPRASTCSFDLTVDGKPVHVPIELSTIVAGSTNPYAVSPVHDWAVAHLAHRVEGVRPYTIASGIHTDESMTFVSRGHIDWGDAKEISMEECQLHDQIDASAGGTREFSFDCDTGDGASGGALMFDKNRSQIGGVLVGWLSNHPDRAVPFGHTHFNFAVTMEGDFRSAVIAAAGSMMATK
jgi:hypothetical protein